MDKVEMPESIWIKVQEGHHERYISVYSVPATEHTEYVPASRLAEAVALLKDLTEWYDLYCPYLSGGGIGSLVKIIRDTRKLLHQLTGGKP